MKIENYSKALSKTEHLIADLTQITDLEKLITSNKSFTVGDNSIEEKIYNCNLRIKQINMLKHLENEDFLQYSYLSNEGYHVNKSSIRFDELKEFIEEKANLIENIFKEIEARF